MRRISCVVIDDEPPAIRVLEKYIASLPHLHLAGTFTNPLEAMASLREQPVDLLLLDINMPELSGIHLVKAISPTPQVIFTTAYPEYALTGFDLDAADYLVKPFSRERFIRAVEKAARQLPSGASGSVEEDHLIVKADRKIYRIRYEDILFCEAYGDYVKIVLEKEMLMPKETLSTLENQLPSDKFLRVHRSFLIALNKLNYLEGNQLRIGKYAIPIGQSYRDTVLAQLKH